MRLEQPPRLLARDQLELLRQHGVFYIRCIHAGNKRQSCVHVNRRFLNNEFAIIQFGSNRQRGVYTYLRANSLQ